MNYSLDASGCLLLVMIVFLVINSCQHSASLKRLEQRVEDIDHHTRPEPVLHDWEPAKA